MRPQAMIVLARHGGEVSACVHVPGERCLTIAAELLSIATRGSALTIYDDAHGPRGGEWIAIATGRIAPWLAEHYAREDARVHMHIYGGP